jgi:small subunit ribosomal protein S18
MARNNDRNQSTSSKRAPKDLGRRIKKKPCQFCRDTNSFIDYKDLNTLRKFMSDRGKIRARRVTGNCEQHQRDIAEAIKTARELVLLPYTQRTTTERAGGRGGRGGRGRENPEATLEEVPETNAGRDVEVIEEIIEEVIEDAAGDEVVEIIEIATEEEVEA